MEPNLHPPPPLYPLVRGEEWSRRVSPNTKCEEQTLKRRKTHTHTHKNKWEITECKKEGRKVTYHIDEILESDGGGGALLRPFQQDVSFVGVDFCDELRFVQDLQEVIPRYLTESLRVILPSTQQEPKIN